MLFGGGILLVGDPGTIRTTTASSLEPIAFAATAAFLALAQVIGLVLDGVARSSPGILAGSFLQTRFGFDQLAHLCLPISVAWFVVLGFLLILLHRHQVPLAATARHAGRFITTPFGSVVVALTAMVLFFTLRNEFVNQDGRAFLARFLEDVPAKGAHVTHDEMWELYIHSRFWWWTSSEYGWSLIEGYQFLSALSGVAFVLVLIRTCALLLPGNPVSLLLCVSAGGFMQLFFGDVENYTFAATLILTYLFAALLHLKGAVHIAIPTAVLATAITFHLLAGFLLPSLAYLYLLEAKRRAYKSMAVGLLAFATPIGATLAFFHYNGLPIGDLFTKSHALGHGGHILLMLARPSAIYYWQQLNLLALLFPGFLFVIPLLLFRRIPWKAANIFLAIATLFMLVLQLTWNAQLGVYDDWNLYAAGAIPFSLLVWTNLLGTSQFPGRAEIVAAGAALAGMHSFAWILANRLYGFL